MRLEGKEISIIKENILQSLDDAKFFLFGSRVDDNKKGGDIDICIETDLDVSLTKKLKIINND